MVDLSIIVLSFNTKDITHECLRSLLDTLSRMKQYTTEVIVVDNASTDGSQELLKTLPVRSFFLDKNLGFGAANNYGVTKAQGRYILYLNSDVIQKKIDYDELLRYMDSNTDVGILTARVELQSGKIDPASHRGFPTIWRSFGYFLKLEKLFGGIPLLNRLFGGYHLTYLPLNTIHEIESPSGAFFLTRKEIVDKIGGYDEKFFMYGEDLDLSYRIKELGYKAVYYPKATVLHLKYSSGIKNDNGALRKRIRRHFYKSMGIFYDKHYAKHHNSVINNVVRSIINSKMNSI